MSALVSDSHWFAHECVCIHASASHEMSLNSSGQIILGYNGSVKNGLHIEAVHDKFPSIIFPLGSACIRESLDPKVQK